MVYPGKKRKSYDTPKHPWQAARMAEEVELIKTYGLRNKRELWKAQSTLRRFRADARRLLAESGETGQMFGHYKLEAEQILERLTSYSILKADSNIDDILGLKTSAFLSAGCRPRSTGSDSPVLQSRHVNSLLTAILPSMVKKLQCLE